MCFKTEHMFITNMATEEVEEFQESYSSLLEGTSYIPQVEVTENTVAKVLLQLLVAEVQSFECLWNKYSSTYKQAHKKKAAWRLIAERLYIEGELFICYCFPHFLSVNKPTGSNAFIKIHIG